jgi:hypothetical protein
MLPAARRAGFENTAAVSCPMLSSPLLAWAIEDSQLLLVAAASPAAWRGHRM